jgi:nucleoid-associated protein YgaU
MPVSTFSRYHESSIVKTPGPAGTRLVTSLTLRLPEEPADFPDSIIHTVIGGETLDQLSQRYYGREDLWWRIMDANDLQPANGLDSADPRLFRLPAGDRLIIPPVRVVTRFPRR